jgi:hypothetical protein
MSAGLAASDSFSATLAVSLLASPAEHFVIHV